MKLRVLQVIPGLTPGGISSVVMGWYRGLDLSKYQFDFITFNDGPLRKEIEELGGKIYVIPTLRQSPLRHLKLVSSILNSSSRYDVIHVHNSFKNAILLWQAQKAGVPVRVCHSHTGGIEKKALVPIFSLLKKIASSQSNLHLACGKEAGEFLFGSGPFHIVNNAISVASFAQKTNDRDALAKYQLPLDKKLVIHVGRFSDVKNHRFLIKLAKSTTIRDDFHFVCVGEGPLKQEIQTSIDEAQLRERVSLLPANNDIASLLNVADAFVMPSLFEGVSVALLEAQAASLPCYVSDTISSESDMGLGLVEFLSLSDEKAWVNQLNRSRKKGVTASITEAAFYDHGYSIDGALARLLELYIMTRGSKS